MPPSATAPSHPARPRSRRTAGSATRTAPAHRPRSHAVRSGTVGGNPVTGRTRASAARRLRLGILLAGHVVRELALVVQAHAERELRVGPEHQRVGRTRAGTACRMPCSSKRGRTARDGRQLDVHRAPCAGEDQPKSTGQAPRNLMIGIQRILVEAHVRAVRQRLLLTAPQRQQRRGRSAASVDAMPARHLGNLRTIEQARRYRRSDSGARAPTARDRASRSSCGRSRSSSGSTTSMNVRSGLNEKIIGSGIPSSVADTEQVARERRIA